MTYQIIYSDEKWKTGRYEILFKIFRESIEEKYKKNLISKGYFDTLVGIIYN